MATLPYEQIFPKKKRNKFNANKIVIDDIKFDSQKEGNRYLQLKQLRCARDPKERVVNIETQKKYRCDVNGKHVCNYYADFVVTYADGRVEVEDVKGYKKGSSYAVFKIKKKLVEAIHDIAIKET